MTHKLKATGLALVAVLAMSAFVASAARADFTFGASHTTISGSQVGNQVILGVITCTTVAWTGTSSGTFNATSGTWTEESLMLTPTIAGCKDSLGRTADVTNNSLTHLFTTDGTVHITGSLKFQLTSSGGSVVCTIEIGIQTDNGMVFDNLGGTTGIRLTENTTNLISTTSGGFLNCGVSNGEHKEGTFEGETVLSAKATDGSATSISVDH